MAQPYHGYAAAPARKSGGRASITHPTTALGRISAMESAFRGDGNWPRNTAVRARGYTVGAQMSGSTWFVETRLSPSLLISDAHHSLNGEFGFSANGAFGQMVIIEASPDFR
jgi:hypothetical protein